MLSSKVLGKALVVAPDEKLGEGRRGRTKTSFITVANRSNEDTQNPKKKTTGG